MRRRAFFRRREGLILTQEVRASEAALHARCKADALGVGLIAAFKLGRRDLGRQRLGNGIRVAEIKVAPQLFNQLRVCRSLGRFVGFFILGLRPLGSVNAQTEPPVLIGKCCIHEPCRRILRSHEYLR